MLSYRHAYHAGNHADVLKHSILSLILRYVSQKEKPFTFYDTHAGAGKYLLSLDTPQEKSEASSGIIKLIERTDYPPQIEPYISMCKAMYTNAQMYPGSPEVARYLSRIQDSLILMELHPSEISILKGNFHHEKRIHIHHRDGYSGLIALTPPETVRGIAHIDPSYETVEDWSNTVETLIRTNKRWPAGILVLWYPIVGRKLSELSLLKNKLALSKIPGILDAQLEISKTENHPDSYGLTGSGMIIINPPWTLHADLLDILPWLSMILGETGETSWNLKWLTTQE